VDKPHCEASTPTSADFDLTTWEPTIDILVRLGAVLGSASGTSRAALRNILADAQRQGLDAKRLYEIASRPGPGRWGPFPPYEDVAPQDT